MLEFRVDFYANRVFDNRVARDVSFLNSLKLMLTNKID